VIEITGKNSEKTTLLRLRLLLSLLQDYTGLWWLWASGASDNPSRSGFDGLAGCRNPGGMAG